MTTQFPRCGTLLLLLVSLAVSRPVYAQSRALSQLQMRVWTMDHGLPLDAVRAVQQTADGYIWAGTESGLARFDGARFVPMDAPGSPLYVSRDIMQLEAGPGDTLWVATSTGLLRGRDGDFRRWPGDAALGTGRIEALQADPDGRIWVGTAGAGLYVIEAGGTARPVTGGGFAPRHIRSIALSRSGGPWVATELGVGRVEGGRLAALDPDSAGRDVRSILEDGHGRLWVGTGKGVFRLEGDRLVHAAPSGPLRTAMIWSLHEDARGDVWVASSGHGLHRLSAGGWDQLGPDEGLPGDDVHDLFTDARGDLWAAITGGLALIYAGDVLPITPAQGLSSPVALPVLEDRRGVLWVGTFGGGVTRLGPEGARTWRREDGLPNDVVLSLAEDAGGSIWAGTRAGLRIVDDNGVRRGPVRALDEANVPSLMRDRAGRMWAGTTTSGVFLIDGPRVRSFGPEDGLSGDFVLTLAEARDGSVLVGTEGGGAYVIRDRRVGRLPGLPASAAASVHAFHEDGDGTLWVAASEGLMRLREGRRAVLGRRHGLPDQSIMRMFADDAGHYWLSTNHGVVQVPQAELHAAADGSLETISPRVFTRRDGMPSTEANGAFHPAGWQGMDGRMFFPTMGGVAVFDPEAIAGRSAPARVTIEGITHNGIVVSSTRLPPAASNISIDYTALDYRLGDLAEFEYRLLGFDSAWTRAGTRRTAYYTRLPPRQFTFEVRGRLPGQTWDQAASASLAFRRAPHAWETSAFIAALVLLLAALVFALHRWRVRGLRAREVELLALVRARERAERRYREIFENAHEVVLTLDADGRIIEANQQAGRALIRRPQDLVGIPLASLAEDPSVLEHAQASTRDDIVLDGDLHELTLRTGEDTFVRVEASIRALEEDGRRVGYQMIGRDVTERHRLQERLRHSERMQAVGQLAGGIAHDFNNLLTAISGHAGFLLEGLDDDALRLDAVEIARGAERAAALTRQLLAFSRRQVLQPRVVDLNRVIAGMEQLLRRLIGEHIAFAVELTAEPVHVKADVGQLEQVVANLAVNARDAMPGGGRLDVITRSETIEDPVLRGASLIPPGDYIVLDVSDTGTGMDARTLSRIFEPFFTTKKVGEGTGLGLATVYGIIEQTGGYISVDSVPGAGTTFHIYLPRTAEVPEPVSTPAAPVHLFGSDETILLVEDDDAVRRLIRRILERNDYRMLEAANPRIALDEVLPQYAGRIALLITDVVMPEMGGPEFAARASALRPGMRTIFISGYNDQTMAVNSGLPIEHSFLAKPFTPDELLRKVRTVLDAPAEPT